MKSPAHTDYAPRPADRETFDECQATCLANPEAHCDDYGTTDIVITRNTVRNFTIGIASGTWCEAPANRFVPAYWTEKQRSRRWASGPCEDRSDTDGAIWGGDSPMGNDRHRADMHRHWYVADNAVTNNYPDGNLMFLTFLADSDIAYNHLSRTQNRSDWDALKDSLLPDGCTLGADGSGTILWPTQAECANGSIGRCGVQGKTWECPAEQRGRENGAPCYCPIVTPDGTVARPEPDVMFLGSTSNVDVYGNEGRDPVDNFIQADWSYANLRIWRNRVVDPGNAMLTQAPMLSAPWYVVRNEMVSDSAAPFMPRSFDQMVILNNTFVVRHGTSAQPNAQMLLRSLSRHNLWVFAFEPVPNKCELHGEFWGGTGSAAPAAYQLQAGASHSDYRTDVDYDGLDWDSLPDINPDGRWQSYWQACQEAGKATPCCAPSGGECTLSCRLPGTIVWNNYLTLGDASHFELDPADPTNEFRRLARGCAGGPRNGLYCESDADCLATGNKTYERFNNAELTPLDASAEFPCVYPEATFLRVFKETIFAMCAGMSSDQCGQRLDDYALESSSPNRLWATSLAVEAGDPGLLDRESFLRDDLGADGRTIVPYVVGVPDLGAYGSGQPDVHYGPRP